MSAKRNVFLLGITNFGLDFILYGGIQVIYFTQVTGSMALAMSLFSVAMVSSALFELPTGIFSDFIGRKKTLIVGSVCSLVSVFLYAIGGSYWILFLGALFEGLQRAFHSGNNDALLYDSLKESGDIKQLSKYQGKISSMSSLAILVSVGIGSILAAWSIQLVMWLSVVPKIIILLASLFVVNTKKHTVENNNPYRHLYKSITEVLKKPKLRLLTIITSLQYAIGESAFNFRPMFIASLWPIWALGIPKMISGFGAFLGFWFSGKILNKVRPESVIFVNALYDQIVTLISLVFPNIASPTVMSTTSLPYGTATTAKDSLMQQNFFDESRATVGSVSSFLGNILFGVFAIILGYAADLFGATRALIYLYVFNFLVVLLTWRLKQI